MGDKQTERAVNNQRQRHAEAALAAARRVQEYAGYVIRDLEAGRLPAWHLVQDAAELERRIASLEAVDDTVGIYEAQLADLPSG